MRRKILQAGPTTLSVSLPMGWVKKFDLKPTQELVVEEHGNELKISTTAIPHEEYCFIDANFFKEKTPRMLGIMYMMGYRKMKVSYEDQKINFKGKQILQIDMVMNQFEHMSGMRLWDIKKDSKPKYLVCNQDAEIHLESFDENLNRVHYSLINQAEQVYSLLYDKKDLLEEIRLTERMINQGTDYCVRILTTIGYSNHKKTALLVEYISRLETISDMFFSISKEDITDIAPLKPIFRILKELISESSSIYRKFDKERIAKYEQKIDTITMDFKKNMTTNNSIISYHLFSILRDLSEIVENLYELNYDHFSIK